jgi:hypothetical protein
MTSLAESAAAAARALENARYAVAFTGAGISVESGIPPFRGPGGLWSRYDPGFLEIGYFRRQPGDSWKLIKEIFYDFFGTARPNAAHLGLAELERRGLHRAQPVIPVHQHVPRHRFGHAEPEDPTSERTQRGHGQRSRPDDLVVETGSRSNNRRFRQYGPGL